MNGPHARVTAAATAAALLVTVNGSAAATTLEVRAGFPASPDPCPSPSPAAPSPSATPPGGPDPVVAEPPPEPESPVAMPLDAAPPERKPRALIEAEARHGLWPLLPPLDGHAFRRMAVPPPDMAVPPSPEPTGPETPPDTATSLDDCVPAGATPPPAAAPAPSAPAQSALPAVTRPPVRGKPGAAGVGDSYFKGAGNGGYDVQHYDVAMQYGGRKSGRVDATVTLSAKATQNLSRLNLDFRGPKILGVAVNGRPAKHRRKGQELMITPAAAVAAGGRLSVAVRYAGKPGPIRNNSLGTYGWVPTRDGAIVVAEPDGAPTWLPVNDHPRDKATYAYRITVPRKLQVLANGTPGRTVKHGSTTTYQWAERSPMASYLAMVAIGKFQIKRGKAGSVPVITAVDPRFGKAGNRLHRTTAAALKWETKIFGRYPFATAGGIVDDPRLDYALETQERPVYAGFAPDDDFVVHELAHQWFGNSVSLRKWQDIWLNEGFATYAEWLWAERAKKDSAKKIFKRYYRQPANSPIFNPPPGKPGHRELFGFSVYIRGAMALQALRQRVGDKKFFRILKGWASSRPGRNTSTTEFVKHAEKISGKQLDKLFNAWLYKKGKPKKW